MSEYELIYCREYLKHGNKRRAYMSAFPDSEHMNTKPYELHKRIRIRDYLQAMSEKAEEKAVLDKAWVLNRLAENARLGGEGWKTEQVKTDKDGSQEIIEGYKRDLSSSNRASELIGKELGMFTDRLDIGGLDEVVQALADKADALAMQADSPVEDDTAL